jgi:hypothetical protein
LCRVVRPSPAAVATCRRRQLTLIHVPRTERFNGNLPVLRSLGFCAHALTAAAARCAVPFRRNCCISNSSATHSGTGRPMRSSRSVFLKGSEPHPATLRKLAAWYVRHAAGTQSLDADTAAAALSLLVDDYPKNERKRVRRGLLDVLREAHGQDRHPAAALAL